MPRRWIRLVVLPFALLLLLAACGDDDDSGGDARTEETDAATDDRTDDGGDDGGGGQDAAGFVDAFCTEFGEWGQSVTSTFLALEDIDPADYADPQELLDEFAAALASGEEDTQALVDALNDLEAPDVDGGEEVLDAVTTFAEDIAGLLADAQAEVEAIDADSPTLVEDLEEVNANLQASFEEASSELDAASDDIGEIEELEEAFSDSDACQEAGF